MTSFSAKSEIRASSSDRERRRNGVTSVGETIRKHRATDGNRGRYISSTFVSIQFLSPSFSDARLFVFSPGDRDVALLGPSGCCGQIDDAAVPVPLSNLQLPMLHRSESDGDHRSGWPGVHQRQAKGAERLVEPQLRRQSRAQCHH